MTGRGRKMEGIGTFKVQLTGSNRHVKRMVYLSKERNCYLIKLYGNLVLVARDNHGWYTLGKY